MEGFKNCFSSSSTHTIHRSKTTISLRAIHITIQFETHNDETAANTATTEESCIRNKLKLDEIISDINNVTVLNKTVLDWRLYLKECVQTAKHIRYNTNIKLGQFESTVFINETMINGVFNSLRNKYKGYDVPIKIKFLLSMIKRRVS